jgi:hypothetical protein
MLEGESNYQGVWIMKKSVLSLLTGAALLGSVGVASAAEPMVLTNAALDEVTAAGSRQFAIAAAVNVCSRGAVCQANAAAVNQRGFVNVSEITQLNIAIDVLND